MAGVSSISLTNVGKLYTSVPSITLSAPTTPAGDSARASGTLTITDGKISSSAITDSGGYYLSAPSVSLTNVFDLTNLQDSGAKFGDYSYQFGKDNSVDSDLDQFTNVFDPAVGEENVDVKLEFWLYAEDSQQGDFLKFKGIGEEEEQDGSLNKVKIDGRKVHWFFTSADSAVSVQLDAVTCTLA